MLKSYPCQPDRYPQCLAAISRMLASPYQWARHILAVEYEGQVVVTALTHDREAGVVCNFPSGGYEPFRYASPYLVVDFLDTIDQSDQIAIDDGDPDWYLEVLSADASMRGRGVGRWLVSEVLPDFVAKRGGRAYGFVTSTEKNARFYLSGDCELLDRVGVHMCEGTCLIWAFQRCAELL